VALVSAICADLGEHGGDIVVPGGCDQTGFLDAESVGMRKRGGFIGEVISCCRLKQEGTWVLRLAVRSCNTVNGSGGEDDSHPIRRGSGGRPKSRNFSNERITR